MLRRPGIVKLCFSAFGSANWRTFLRTSQISFTSLSYGENEMMTVSAIAHTRGLPRDQDRTQVTSGAVGAIGWEPSYGTLNSNGYGMNLRIFWAYIIILDGKFFPQLFYKPELIRHSTWYIASCPVSDDGEPDIRSSLSRYYRDNFTWNLLGDSGPDPPITEVKAMNRSLICI